MGSHQEACAKCGGKGEIPMYKGIAGGVCFDCKGTGQIARKTMPDRRAKAKAKREQDKLTKRQEREARAIMQNDADDKAIRAYLPKATEWARGHFEEGSEAPIRQEMTYAGLLPAPLVG